MPEADSGQGHWQRSMSTGSRASQSFTPKHFYLIVLSPALVSFHTKFLAGALRPGGERGVPPGRRDRYLLSNNKGAVDLSLTGNPHFYRLFYVALVKVNNGVKMVCLLVFGIQRFGMCVRECVCDSVCVRVSVCV